MTGQEAPGVRPGTAPGGDDLRAALGRGGVIDITTTGRRSREPRRIEIAFHAIGGRIYVSGMPSPRRRSWLANLEADPRFTFHLKGPVPADLPATARIVDDEAERRAILPHVARAWGRDDIEAMVRHSPLIEVTIDGVEPGPAEAEWPARATSRPARQPSPGASVDGASSPISSADSSADSSSASNR